MTDEQGLWGLLLSSFLASTLLPGGSEAALLYAHYQKIGELLPLWGIATLGNTLGGLTSWTIGLWLKRRFPEVGLSEPKQAQALSGIQKYGAPLLLFSWLPLIGDPLCLVAGWAGIRVLQATLYIALGKGLRYGVLLLPFA